MIRLLCLDDDGERRALQGNKKPTIVRTITSMQEKSAIARRDVYLCSSYF